ncbi:MAG TPA: hypothetical protein VFG69_01900, partial [Nannocystaceae bacterium]|nr:hypothetical protein [Nannocystaceae bacterium]
MATDKAQKEDSGSSSGFADPQHVVIDSPVGVKMMAADAQPPTDRGPVPLWIAIQNRQVDFTAYSAFINAAFCTPEEASLSSAGASTKRSTEPHGPYAEAMSSLRSDRKGTHCANLGRLGHGINAYELLKTATEVFLLLECGVFIAQYGPIKDGKRTGTIPGAEPNRVEGKLDLDTLQKDLTRY